MRIVYWTETAQEAWRETFDAARRRWPYALIILAGVMVVAMAVLLVAGTDGWRTDLLVAAAWLVAVVGFLGALFSWKLISIPPRRHAAQAKEISRLSSELEHVRSGAKTPG